MSLVIPKCIWSASVAEGHADMTRKFTEKDWSNVETSNVNSYVKSKTLAEKAAWDFIRKEGNVFARTRTALSNSSIMVVPYNNI